MSRLTVSAFLVVIAAGGAPAQIDFREVARTGITIPSLPSETASFGHWVSINDQGQVAFKVTLQDSSQAIVRATPNADGEYDTFEIVETANGSSVLLGDYVSINSNGEVSYRRRTSAGGVTFSIRRDTTRVAFATTNDPHNWYFRGLMQPTDVCTEGEGMVSFYGMVLEGTQIRHQIRKGDGSQGDHVSHTTLIATQPEFNSFDFYTSINDAGMVVFTGSHPTEGTGVFMGDGGPTTPVATSAGGFSATGVSPTINNLNHVGFYGDGPAGEGIYVWAGGTPALTVPIADPVTSFASGSRVMINDSDCLAFVGTTEGDAGDVEALFRFTGTEPEVLVKIGNEINGAAPIDDLEFWDGLNNTNQAVFWAHHDDPNGPFESIWVAPGSTTVLVFINGDNNLEAYAITDFLEMAAVGSSDNLDIVVQFDRHPWPPDPGDPNNPCHGYSDGYDNWMGTKRFHIQPGDEPNSAPVQDLGEVNMGDPNELIDFAVWGITHYPAAHYLLVIWNHGGGWGPRGGRGVSWDETTPGSDFFTTNEVRDALEAITTQAGVQLDILGFDACLMQMLEVAYAVRSSCQYVVGSEELVPVYGWAYNVFLANITPRSSPADICDEIVGSYDAQGGPTLSAFATAGVDDVADAVDRLADELLSGMCAEPSNIQQAREDADLVTFDYDNPGYGPPDQANENSYVDLGRLCQLLEVWCDAPSIKDAANDVCAALAAGRIANETNGAYYAPAEGLSIYFPDHQPDDVDGDDYYANYQNESGTPADLDFVADTRWDHFLKAYVGQSPPGDLDGDGDVDLSDLAQLLGNYGETSGMTYEDGDLDGDEDVDLSDLAALLAVYGTTCE